MYMGVFECLCVCVCVCVGVDACVSECVRGALCKLRRPCVTRPLLLGRCLGLRSWVDYKYCVCVLSVCMGVYMAVCLCLCVAECVGVWVWVFEPVRGCACLEMSFTYIIKKSGPNLNPNHVHQFNYDWIDFCKSPQLQWISFNFDSSLQNIYTIQGIFKTW